MARKPKTREERLAHRFAIINRAAKRRCLREALKYQRKSAKYSAFARSLRYAEPAIMAAWQSVAAYEAKWATHYLCAAVNMQTDERKLLTEATARLAEIL
jgi:hypothetical protein